MKRKLHEDWFYLVHEDLAFAKAGLRDGFFTHVCFLSQQAVEKAMKGYLVFLGREYPKTNGLITLLGLMNVDWFDAHIRAVKKLSTFYVPLRNPDTMAGSLPEGLPDQQTATDALQWAHDIVRTIEAHIHCA